MKQVTSVNHDFWISAPSSRLAPLRDLFYTSIPYTEHIYLGILLLLTLLTFLIFLKQRTTEAYWALVCDSALWGILLFTTWYSMHVRPILLSRYLIMPLCLSILACSSIARFLNKYITAAICLFCVIIGGHLYVLYISAIPTESNHNTKNTIAFADENFNSGDIVLYIDTWEDNGYFDNCLEYYFPDAVCISVKASQISDLEKELTENNMLNSHTAIWFLDTCHFMQENRTNTDNFTMEFCGSYGFSAMTFDIYRITQ